MGEAPEEARNVFRQRSRWTKGHMQVGAGCLLYTCHRRLAAAVCVCVPLLAKHGLCAAARADLCSLESDVISLAVCACGRSSSAGPACLAHRCRPATCVSRPVICYCSLCLCPA